MLWKNRRQSTNIEDRRGMGGGGAGMALGGVGTLVIVALALLFGVDPREILQQGGGQTAPQVQSGEQYVGDAHEEELREFVGVVLADTEAVWNQVFPEQLGRPYEEPTLVLFTGQVESACGYASAAVGPFYCPADNNVYLDLTFLDELRTRFGAPGDFADAYVIAHEVGHHIQNQLGITDKVDAMRGRLSQAEYNELSVRLELQADFLAGMWAHYAQESMGTLEPGDIEEALTAATAIGDDRLQMEQQGYVVPDSFTHGTSEQRMRWFRKGYETGDFKQGDTFAASNL